MRHGKLCQLLYMDCRGERKGVAEAQDEQKLNADDSGAVSSHKDDHNRERGDFRAQSTQ